jgi:hypothetical protein
MAAKPSIRDRLISAIDRELTELESKGTFTPDTDEKGRKTAPGSVEVLESLARAARAVAALPDAQSTDQPAAAPLSDSQLVDELRKLH